jgi:IclR family transcriptional regulator, KDG regulon repressor
MSGAETAEPDAGRYSIAAVDRALDLIEALARIGPAPLADIAKEAHCTRTAGFRLLRTMEARGFAIQDKARGAWRLGARWGLLGRAASAQGALAAVAMPFMTALGQSCGETVYLRVRDGVESETVAAYRPDQALRLYTDVGRRRPLHAGCSRVLLAYAPDTVRKQVLGLRLPRFTPATRTDPDWLLADMQRIRARGWLLTAEEVEAGAVSIAAPVRDGSGLVIAVLFIGAPTLRMRPHRARSLLPAVLDAAARLSVALGADEQAVAETDPAPAPPGISGSGLLARQAG